MHFEELNLTRPLLRALHDVGYEAPSPIQEQAIPPLLEGRDLLGCAQTGTGKTAAFALPLLQLMDATPARGSGRPIRALILTPTRELAAQIQESFTAYGRYLRLRSVVIFGGVGQQPQVDAIKRGADILVATPGRLLDLIGQGYIKLRDLEFFVLDEADRMLDMGFIHDIRRVIKELPTQRQTLFFSATMPDEIKELSSTLLNNPAFVAVAPVSSTVDSITQSILFTDKNSKRDLLFWLLKTQNISSALVFTRTKHLADRVAKYLQQKGIHADSIHGDKAQGARLRALADFKAGRCRVLVATDIAARGIDINELSHVINFDLPDVPETYVHRIGRTGRAGLSGTAISFCTAEELGNLKDIEKLIKKPVAVMEDHPYPPADGIPLVPVKAVKKENQGRQQAQSPRQPRMQNQSQEQNRGRGQNQSAPRPAKAAHPVESRPVKAAAPAPNDAKFAAISLDDEEVRSPRPANVKLYGSEEPRPLGRVMASGGTARGGSRPTGNRPSGAGNPSGGKQGGGHTAPQQPRHEGGARPQGSGHSSSAQPRHEGSGARPQGSAGSNRSRKNDRRRDPVWIPSNNQPIVTRPQSYNTPPPAPEASTGSSGNRRRRRRPSGNGGGNTGGTQG